jgi:hypothetical protein
MERSRNLSGVPQAQHDLWHQFELVEDLMPHRHHTRSARILETKISVTDALLEKSHNFTPDLDDTRISPPGHPQGKIMKTPQGTSLLVGIIIVVEEAEDPVVKLDDLPPLPMSPVVPKAHPNIVGHIDPERAQDVRTKRCAATVHADHENDRPALHRARNCGYPAAPRWPD